MAEKRTVLLPKLCPICLEEFTDDFASHVWDNHDWDDLMESRDDIEEHIRAIESI